MPGVSCIINNENNEKHDTTSMSTYLGQKGYSIYKNTISVKEQQYIRDELMVKPYMPKSPIQQQSFPIYLESPNKLYVPRYFGIQTYGEADESRISEGDDINIEFKGDLREYQNKIVDIYLKEATSSDNGGGGLLEVPCGRGKCMSHNTPIMMYDGTIKMVQNILIGEKLMGDNSEPRNVLSLARGKEMMYDIIPENGDKYTVNESHILSLMCVANYGKYEKGQIYDIPLLEYISDVGAVMSGEDSPLVGYRVGVEFSYKEIDDDPYTVGCRLGKFINKTIPHNYKCNTRKIRLELLAGILDTCATVYNSGYYIQHNKEMLDDIIFLVRSLGLATDNVEIFDTYSQLFKINIYGKRVLDIPVKKKSGLLETNLKDDNDNDDDLLTKINVVKTKVDNYYGFEIDGNHRYLLGDFTVTHNTVMGLNIISKIKKKTLIIVHKSFLSNQWKERIEQFLPDAKVGIIQGQIVDIEGKDIVIGMLQSLSMKTYPQEMFSSFGLTIVDECHHISSEVFSRSLLAIVTKYTLGLSATMQRKDGLTKVFKMFLGDIIYHEKREKDDSVLVKVVQYKVDDDEFNEVKYDFRGNTAYSTMISKICEYSHRTEFIISAIKKELEEKAGQQIMILAQQKNILVYLQKAIEYQNIASVGFYVGGMKEADLKKTEEKTIVLATYSMAAEALDIKTLTTLFLATPRTDITQAVGRILRVKHDRPLVVDIVDSHDVFQRQYKKRLSFYKKNGYNVLQSNNLYSNWEVIYDKQSKTNLKKEKKPTLCPELDMII